MVQSLEFTLYDDRECYRGGSARGDIYKTTHRTLVLFFESPDRQAYVLPNLKLVTKDRNEDEDVVCTVKDMSSTTSTASLLRHLLFGLTGASSTHGVVSVHALEWQFSHIEDVESMLARKQERGARCIFSGDASTFTTALQIVQQVGVTTVKRKVVHAALGAGGGDGEGDDEVEGDAFTPLPPLLLPPAEDVDEFGVEESKSS